MRSHAKALVAMTALLTTLAIGVAGASAGTTRAHQGYLASQPNPHAIAVDQSNGDVYVIDTNDNAVMRYDSAGNPVPFSALNGSNVINGSDAGSDNDVTPQGGFALDSSSQVAIDFSGTATDGNVYVANSNHSVVNVFDATGAYAGQLTGTGTNSSEPTQTWGDTFAFPCGVTTAANGDLYVATAINGQIDRYAPSGAVPTDADLEAQITELPFGTCGLGLDAAGNPHAATNAFGELGVLSKYAAADFGTAAPAGTVIDASTTALFVDPSNGDVFASNGANATQYDASGAQIVSFGQGVLTDSRGIAIDRSPTASNGAIYAADSSGFVATFGAIVTQPEVTILPASDIGLQTATLNGEVNPGGEQIAYRFQYRAVGAAQWGESAPKDAGSGSASVPVEAELTGLVPDTEYEFRLVLTNVFGGQIPTEVETFRTAIGAPLLATSAAAEVTATSARLRGLVNPAGALTSYYFEWGADTSYGQRVPLSPESIGSGNQQVKVSRVIDGLSPQTTYHYRVVAENGEGESVGTGRSFTTTAVQAACPNEAIRLAQGSTHLPECMAWEKASPEDKNGGDAYFANGLVQVSPDGSRIAWSAVTSFAGGSTAPRVNDYLSVRSLGGWNTTNLAQPGMYDQVGVSKDMQFGYRWFDEDLRKGVFIRNDGPGLNRNLYLQNFDSGTAGGLTLDHLSEPDLFGRIRADFPVRDATADLSHVLFESVLQLTPEAPVATGAVHLYLWKEGVIEFVGILPDGSSAPSSVSGRGGALGNNALEQRGVRDMSSDGSRVFFTVPIAKDGYKGWGGELYVRKGDTSVHISASQRTDCAQDPTCGGDGEPDPAPDPDPAAAGAPAFFASATDNGNYVFFRSCADLTDDANGSCDKRDGYELYRYEVATGDLVNVTAGLESGVQLYEFIEADEDGDNAYFVALTGSAMSAYVWRDGAVKRIGSAGEVPAVGVGNSSTAVAPPRLAQVSPDGRYFSWGTEAQLTGTPTDGNLVLYLYDAVEESTVCISCPSDGSAATSDSTYSSFQAALSQRQYYPDVINEERGWVVFETRQALVPRDTNAETDVYRFVMATGEHQLLSSGTLKGDAHLTDVSADGSTVAIVTRQQLVASDRDNSSDVYAVRVNGGFAEPERPAPPCLGEECQGASPQELAAGTLGSAADSGPTKKPTADCSAKKKAVSSAKQRLQRAESVPKKQAAKRKLRDARKRHTSCVRRAVR